MYNQGKSTISSQTSLVAKNNNLQYEIRKIITQMQSEEEQLLEQRVSKSKSSIRSLDNEPQPSIKFVSQGHCTHALLDEKLLYSILGNLLSNAIEYSAQGGNIHLILSCEAQAEYFRSKTKVLEFQKKT